MILKINDTYINVGSVGVNRQAKVFDNIADNAGDFSYNFDIPLTTPNLQALGIDSLVDQLDKSVYTINDVELLNSSGETVYKGYLRVSVVSDSIDASFFSGNNNWFNMITGEMLDLDLTQYDTIINEDNIISSWQNTDGIIFPVINTGEGVTQRSLPTFILDDFHPFIYVKNVINKIFTNSGLKLTGSLFSDPVYDRLITSNNGGVDPLELESRTVKVSKSDVQVINGVREVVEFNTEESVGTNSNWSSAQDRYTADVPMRIDATLTLSFAVADSLTIEILKNGTTNVGELEALTISSIVVNISDLFLDTGDYIDVRATDNSAPFSSIGTGRFTITPISISKAFSNSLLPDKSQIDFVTDVFSLFNTVIDYDSFSKTVNVDLFKDVVRESEIDISQYVDPVTARVDYTELISDYGKINNFSYAEHDVDVGNTYNKGRAFKYGSGQLNSGNDYTEPVVDVVDSPFVALPESNLNGTGYSLPKVNYTELEDGEEISANVTLGSGGRALFTVASSFNPQDNEIFEVFDSTVGIYNGQYVSIRVSSTAFFLVGLLYTSNATATVRRKEMTINKNEDQLLLISVPNIQTFHISEYFNFFIQNNFENVVATAYFYKPRQNKPYDDYKFSLSFGPNSIPGAYQITMLENYWGDFGEILIDPVKVFIDAKLPKAVYDSITFKQPLRVKTGKFNAQFFPNRITGYEESYLPCELELIKL